MIKKDSRLRFISDDIVNPMKTKKPKTYEVTRERMIVIYPALDENKEKGKLRRMLRRLIQIKKGH